MARGLYSAVFQGVAVTAAQDAFLLITTSSVPIDIHYISLGQSSDAGDAQDELLRVRLRRGMTTNGSGGTTPTGQLLTGGDAAVATTVHANDTTASSAGTIVELWEECFNVRAGWIWCPTPAMRIRVPISGKFAVNLPAAPADSLTMSGTIVWEELS
jgi:hypothetical protein